MSALRNLTVAALFSFLILYMIDDSASMSADCCLHYSQSRLPFRLISGFAIQRSNEMCDIDAVIFYTSGGRAICTNPEDRWVKRILIFLSKKLEEMSIDG
ncbi:C-C motif chemokine 20-like [Pristis pectinata]|uniref:C-C motif chemokine 20-like n=1 Tax=Pristis pectinata TaxID=685728 RepID=UPI00223CE266|nr:C-C motif chemokine 20-like [Pristis pectinata]